MYAAHIDKSDRKHYLFDSLINLNEKRQKPKIKIPCLKFEFNIHIAVLRQSISSYFYSISPAKYLDFLAILYILHILIVYFNGIVGDIVDDKGEDVFHVFD